MEDKKGTIKNEMITHLDEDIERRSEHAILLLPENWAAQQQEPIYAGSTDSVLKLFRQNNVPVETLGTVNASTDLQDYRSVTWVAPTLVISWMMLSQNPSLVSLANSVIGNYVTDIFKGIEKDPPVKLNIIYTKPEGKHAHKLQYEGPVSGLTGVAQVLSEFDKDE